MPVIFIFAGKLSATPADSTFCSMDCLPFAREQNLTFDPALR